MASIITEQFRKNAADLLVADISGSTSYYVGLGKSDEWYEPLSTNINAPFPKGTIDDTRNLQYALTDLLKVNESNTSYVIPRVQLSSVSYKQYSTYDPACFYPSDNIKPCYFVDDDSGNIYLFVYSKNGVAISQNNITAMLPYIQGGEPAIFFGNSHLAIRIGQAANLSPFNNEQFVEINTTIGLSNVVLYSNRLHGFHVMDGGSYSINGGNYTSVTSQSGTAEVYKTLGASDGSTPPLQVPVLVDFINGTIVRVTPTVDYFESVINATAESNLDFTDARVQLVISISGVTETVAPSIAPMISRNGFGYNIREYTPSWYLGFLVNSRESTHEVYSTYRQVSLLRNPMDADDSIILTASNINMKKSFVLSGFTTNVAGYQITQGDRRIGVVDSIDTNTSRVYYNNSIKYGFDTPITSAPITFVKPGLSNVTSVSNPSSLLSPDFTYGSADVMFIDNRAFIQRSADQNEELKIIIQL